MPRYRITTKEYVGNPWDKQEGETSFQYARFRTFLELGKGRSLALVKDLLAELGDQIKANSLQELAGAKRWRDRANRWDQAQDENILRRLHLERQAAIKRHKDAAQSLFEKAMQALEAFEPADMTPSDVEKCIKLAYTMEKELYHIPEIQSGMNDSRSDENEFSDLSDMERKERLMELARELESRALTVD